MSFDAIFDQPDIVANLEDIEFEATTYPATATRKDSRWTVSTDDLPGGQAVQVEGSLYRDVEDRIQGLVAEKLGVDPATVIVSVAPADPDARAALHALTGARIVRARAEQEERDVARRTARLLTEQGWSAEDVGTVLRLPADRVASLVGAPGA